MKQQQERKLRGRGRPKSPLSERMWLRLTAEEQQLLKDEAAALGIELAAHVRGIIVGRKARTP